MSTAAAAVPRCEHAFSPGLLPLLHFSVFFIVSAASPHCGRCGTSFPVVVAPSANNPTLHPQGSNLSSCFALFFSLFRLYFSPRFSRFFSRVSSSSRATVPPVSFHHRRTLSFLRTFTALFVRTLYSRDTAASSPCRTRPCAPLRPRSAIGRSSRRLLVLLRRSLFFYVFWTFFISFALFLSFLRQPVWLSRLNVTPPNLHAAAVTPTLLLELCFLPAGTQEPTAALRCADGFP
jgi:hypothetical protein